MKRNRRLGKADHQRPVLQRWRLWGGVVGGVVLVLFLCRHRESFSAPAPHRAPALPAVAQDYKLLERSWAALPSAPPAEDSDPEESRLAAMRAKQWQNMDICVQGGK